MNGDIKRRTNCPMVHEKKRSDTYKDKKKGELRITQIDKLMREGRKENDGSKI